MYICFSVSDLYRISRWIMEGGPTHFDCRRSARSTRMNISILELRHRGKPQAMLQWCHGILCLPTWFQGSRSSECQRRDSRSHAQDPCRVRNRGGRTEGHLAKEKALVPRSGSRTRTKGANATKLHGRAESASVAEGFQLRANSGMFAI